MRSFIRKLFGLVRLYRLGTFRLILNRLFSGIFRYQTIILYYYDLNEADSITPQKEESITFEKIGNAHQEGLLNKLCTIFPGPTFSSRIKQENKECYIGLNNGEVVAYGWITYKNFFIEELNYTYPLENDEFFIYDCFVAPEYRGEGIYPAMLCKILKDYSEEGACNLAYIGVSSANVGSIRGIEKTGFMEYNRIRYIKWLNKEKWRGLGCRPVTATAPGSAAGTMKKKTRGSTIATK